MNNQNNPYPDLSNQPLVNNQQGPIPQQNNQGYMPPQQNQYQRNFCLMQLLPLLPLTTPIRVSLPETRETRDLCQETRDSCLTKEEWFLDGVWCVRCVVGRLTTSPRRCREEWPISGVSACLSSRVSAAAYLSAWIPVSTLSWCVWFVSVSRPGRKPTVVDCLDLSSYLLLYNE